MFQDCNDNGHYNRVFSFNISLLIDLESSLIRSSKKDDFIPKALMISSTEDDKIGNSIIVVYLVSLFLSQV